MPIPKEQELKYWYKNVDGSLSSFFEAKTKEGWIIVQIIMDKPHSDSAYLLLNKY